MSGLQEWSHGPSQPSEGAELASSHEHTKSTPPTLTAEQPLVKYWNLPEKSFHNQRHKEETSTRWVGGVLSGQKQTPYPLVGDLQVGESLHCRGPLPKSESWAPRQASQPQGLALGRGASGVSGCEGQQGLTAGQGPTGLGEQISPLTAAHKASCSQRLRARAATSQKPGPDPPAGLGGLLGGSCSSPRGTEMVVGVSGSIHVHELSFLKAETLPP